MSRTAGRGGCRDDAGELHRLLGPELLDALDRFEMARDDWVSPPRHRPVVPAQDLALLLWLRRRQCAGEALAELDCLLGPNLLKALEAFGCAVDRVRWRDVAGRTSETAQRLVRAQTRWDATALFLAEALMLVGDRVRRTSSR